MGNRASKKCGMVEAGIEIRSSHYSVRFRVPAGFHVVEPPKEFNRSLQTDSLEKAKARYAVERRALERRWEALLLAGAGPGTRPALIGGVVPPRELVSGLPEHHNCIR